MLKTKIIFILSLFILSIFSVSKIEAASSCPGPNGRLPINSSTCFNNVLLKCSSTGVVNYTVCTYGCSNNACKEKTNPNVLPATCTTPNGKIPINTSTCFAKALYKCSNTGSLSYTNCTYGCSDNVCRGKISPTPTPTPKPTLVPTPRPTLIPMPTPTSAPVGCSAPSGLLPINSSICFGWYNLYTCQSDRSLIINSCPYGCTGNSCSPASCGTSSSGTSPRLALNDTMCIGNDINQCQYNGGPGPGLYRIAICPNGCLNGACKTSQDSTPISGPPCSTSGGPVPQNSTVCYSNVMYSCQSPGTVYTNNCTYGCQNGTNVCNPPPSCTQKGGLCIPGFLCMGNSYITGDSCSLFSCCMPRPSYPTQCSAPSGGSMALNTSICYANKMYACSSTGVLTSSYCPAGCQTGSSTCNVGLANCWFPGPGSKVIENTPKCYLNEMYSCTHDAIISSITCPNGCQDGASTCK